MKLLILGSAILACEPLTETETEIQSADVIYPKHVIEGWLIVDVPVPDGFTPQGCEWVDGAVVEKPPVVIHPTVTDYTDAVQSHLDSEAQTHRYYSILSACTYATSANAQFKEEGQACVVWRDAVWALCYSTMAQVEAGEIPQPTVAELLVMMPPMVWPA